MEVLFVMSSPNSSIYVQRRILVALIAVCVLALLVVLGIGISHIIKHAGSGKDPSVVNPTASSVPVVPSDTAGNTPDVDSTAEPSSTQTADTPQPSPSPSINYNDVVACSSAQASLFGFYTELMVNGQMVSSFSSDETITFLSDSDYAQAEGVLTFRGSCFRQNPFYGVAEVTDGKLEIVWTKETGSVPKGEGGNYSGTWCGSGWTGQALLVKWDTETKAVMNMFDSAKANDDLIEVIYATMDGNIYFVDMETGEPTRNRIVMGVPFKGAGSIDPRGLPILYVGQGDHYSSEGKAAKAYAISLVDGSVLATFGAKPDSFALRSWHAYDSAAIVDGETDTLFYPGENGILYRVKLNTSFDKSNGTLTMSPDTPVKVRYSATRTINDGYWLGYESSAVAWRNYLYVCCNAGFMQCIDVNTMKTVWVQDIWDDTNATPVLEEDPENGTAYLYVGCTLDNKADGNGQGKVAFFKIDACTGEILWQNEFTVYTTSHITGGIMSSAILGEGSISGLVITTVASYGAASSGTMYAFDTKTGATVWSLCLSGYAWSSPVALYDADGAAYIVQCDSMGDIYVIDGNGQELDRINVESNIEASPVAFGNYIVIGTRVKGIFGIKIF